MLLMMEQVLNNLHNYFTKPTGIYARDFTISSGALDVLFLKDGQYFRIKGSTLNDGVYKYPATGLANESFRGEVWAMTVPPAVIALVADIEAWCAKNPDTGYTSEAFGGYSYSRGTNPGTGAPIGWEGVFRGRLNAWRKIS